MKEAGLCAFLATVVLFVFASEAIANDREAAIAYAREQLALEGFSPLTAQSSAAAYIVANQAVESGRLVDSGAKVIKMTRKMGEVLQGNVVTPDYEWNASLAASNWEISEYFEVAVLDDGLTKHTFLRPLNPEEVMQYERDAEGVTNEQMAAKAEGMADGIGMMMDVLGSLGLPVFSVKSSMLNPWASNASLINKCEDWTSGNSDGDLPPKVKAFKRAIAMVVGPECFLRLSADHLRQLKEQTAEEKLEAKKEMEEALEQVVELVSAELTSVTVGMDLSDAGPPQGAIWPEVIDQMLASAEPSHSPDDEYTYSWAGQSQNAYGSEWRVVPASLKSGNGLGAQSLGGRFGRKAAPAAEGSMKFSRLELTIDRETYKRVGMKMVGTMEQNGQVRPIVMDQVNSDFRMVPGSEIYEPYRESTRVTGLVSPEELAQMRRQLADLDRQLSGMSPQERAQMEQMMGGQLGMMRSLAKDGSIEIVRITTNIEINPALGQSNRGVAGGSFVSDEMLDTITGGELGSGAGGSGQGAGAVLLDDPGLVRMIQTSLNTLGYNPGAPTGELNRATVVAITQFEAAKGMPVTGQATPQLAGILAAAVDAAQ